MMGPDNEKGAAGTAPHIPFAELMQVYPQPLTGRKSLSIGGRQ